MQVIAHIRTDFKEKFGLPRQSSLVDSLEGRIVFEPEFRNPEALRGIEEYEYLWIIWAFENEGNAAAAGPAITGEAAAAAGPAITDEAAAVISSTDKGPKWKATVRPPRLGGNTRMGVFATRSPFRPNPIGLSCVKLLGVEQTSEGWNLRVGGIDMRDNTPIYDIKPYLPYVDAHPNARGGFAARVESDNLTVSCEPSLIQKVEAEKREALIAVLSQDPRPHYQKDPERIYGMDYAGYTVKFRVDGDVLQVVSIE